MTLLGASMSTCELYELQKYCVVRAPRLVKHETTAAELDTSRTKSLAKHALRHNDCRAGCNQRLQGG